jgi:hypothetical protein
MHRRAALIAVASFVLSLVAVPVTAAPEAGPCPTTFDDASFASLDELRAGTQVMADLGPRPTASPAHTEFVSWVEDRLEGIDGLQLSDRPVTIDRQLELEEGTTLEVQSAADVEPLLEVAGAVPYSKPVAATGPLVSLPAGTAIADTDVQGKVVVRPAAPGLIQYAVFGAVAYYVHDPGLTFDYTANYERDWIGAAQRIIDLEQAQAGGAAGLVFVHGLPRDQVKGQYGPYPGVHWDIPAVYLGADEGAALEDAIALGDATATIAVAAEQARAETRTLIATLPGKSDERIVIESHTDGMNAVWDNGPIAILAMAEHLAALPIECRPRTFEFVFTTAHLYLAEAGAIAYAEELDADVDEGTVALVVALEHLGAREYEAVARTDGPGRVLEETEQSEMFAIFSMESPVLVANIIDQVNKHDLRRSFVLRGADAPQAGFPPHRSFGGEGGPYREQIVPTIAAITGPWTLFDPEFTLEELVDVDLMRRQALAFGDVVLAVDDVPREVLAGADNAYRLGRDLTEGGAPNGDVVVSCSLNALASMLAVTGRGR